MVDPVEAKRLAAKQMEEIKAKERFEPVMGNLVRLGSSIGYQGDIWKKLWEFFVLSIYFNI
ncbi:hypothetical protein RND71_005185 [Anisodus tanguticus]|uniref:Uncharacterized protein n=1 Tax=Anisodus tanguticus TaxID=243964 RepID=A0AAE1SRX8_9SOLA|nr:hypothetical protein RND71_005185 [Anisodus tanguticus]